MKAHVYLQKVYESLLDASHGHASYQTRVYIPEIGVFGYHPDSSYDVKADEFKHFFNSVDFFHYDKEVIQKAKNAVSGQAEDAEYKGEIELPDDVVAEMSSQGKKVNEARAAFTASGQKLAEIVDKAMKEMAG